MNPSSRSAGVTTTNGSSPFETFLSNRCETGFKSGLHTKAELELIKELREADARHPSGLCPKQELPAAVASAYDASKFHRYRDTFHLQDGVLVKLRKSGTGQSYHPVIPREEVEGVLYTLHHQTHSHPSGETLFTIVSCCAKHVAAACA